MIEFPILRFIALATLTAACGSSDSDSSGGGGSGANGSTGSTGQGPAPTVISNTPTKGATDVPTNANASVTFSEAMDCTSLTTTTFTIASGTTKVPGTIVCANAKAVFWPSAHMTSNSPFTATVTTGAKSVGGVHLAATHEWSFTTGALVAAGQPVDLGKSGEFVVLAKAAISTVPASAITGNIGVSPAAADAITGFSLSADATNVFSTSPQVTGKVFAANYAVPTPGNLTTAISDMELAFTDAAARAPDVTELGAGNIGGQTLTAGVYKWGTGLLIPTDLTLTGNPNDVWVFQIAQDLTISSAAHITLTGGAKPENVFWQVAGLVDVGTTAHVEGVVLTQTAITLRTGASVNGRLLAQTAVNLDQNAVVAPAL